LSHVIWNVFRSEVMYSASVKYWFFQHQRFQAPVHSSTQRKIHSRSHGIQRRQQHHIDWSVMEWVRPVLWIQSQLGTFSLEPGTRLQCGLLDSRQNLPATTLPVSIVQVKFLQQLNLVFVTRYFENALYWDSVTKLISEYLNTVTVLCQYSDCSLPVQGRWQIDNSCECVFCRSQRPFISNHYWHHSDKCDSVMVSWTDEHCQYYISILQSHTYSQLGLCLCHWYFTYCDVTPARNRVSVLCAYHKLREKFVIAKYYCNHR